MCTKGVQIYVLASLINQKVCNLEFQIEFGLDRI